MTKYILISDLHGKLPRYIPKGDVAIIAGDICPNFLGFKDKIKEAKLQFDWWMKIFRPWIASQPVEKVIMTWGNHDIVGQIGNYFPLSYMGFHYHMWDTEDTLHILNDSSLILDGVAIYGTPWSVTFGGNWAFNKPDSVLALECWNNIPQNTDILIVHGPPYGFGDVCPSFICPGAIEHAGSQTLLQKILEINPKLVICGHIHEGYGVYKLKDTTIINASLLDGEYNLKNEPITWKI